MSELPQMIVAFMLPAAAATPIILRVVLRHQKEMAQIKAQSNPNPQIVSDVQELKQQVADIRELMIEAALQPRKTPIIPQRENQNLLQ